MNLLFFALTVAAPWPENYPEGCVIEEKNRHLTLAFMGKSDITKLEILFKEIPIPSLKLGSVGTFDQLLFLPPRHPRVAALHVTWERDTNILLNYTDILHKWLNHNYFETKRHQQFLPHVTIARSPFSIASWKKHFAVLPLYIRELCLFESLGHSQYKSLWSYPFVAPFEEIAHTADLAYIVRGRDFYELFAHARYALSFSFPPLLSFSSRGQEITSLHEVIIALNEIVMRADHAIGCPFKAVSFHNHLEKKDELLHWEMIVDV